MINTSFCLLQQKHNYLSVQKSSEQTFLNDCQISSSQSKRDSPPSNIICFHVQLLQSLRTQDHIHNLKCMYLVFVVIDIWATLFCCTQNNHYTPTPPKKDMKKEKEMQMTVQNVKRKTRPPTLKKIQHKTIGGKVLCMAYDWCCNTCMQTRLTTILFVFVHANQWNLDYQLLRIPPILVIFYTLAARLFSPLLSDRNLH